MQIYYVKLDHVLYSINYGNYHKCRCAILAKTMGITIVFILLRARDVPTHHVHVYIEGEILWGSGLVLSQVLNKLRLLGYNTGSKTSIATTYCINK